jgi:hypothetical protein
MENRSIQRMLWDGIPLTRPLLCLLWLVPQRGPHKPVQTGMLPTSKRVVLKIYFGVVLKRFYYSFLLFHYQLHVHCRPLLLAASFQINLHSPSLQPAHLRTNLLFSTCFFSDRPAFLVSQPSP